MSKGTNVATFYNAPGFNKLSVFCSECEADDMDLDSIASPAQLIPDLEDDEVMGDGIEHTEYEAWQPVGLPGIRERRKSTRARFNLELTPIPQNIGTGNAKRQLHNIFKHTVTTIHGGQSGIPI